MSQRRRMGRAIIVLPSMFTLANLFFGFWSMVLASRGEFYTASWWIVFCAPSRQLMALILQRSISPSATS